MTDTLNTVQDDLSPAENMAISTDLAPATELAADAVLTSEAVAAEEAQWVPGRLLVQPRAGLSEAEFNMPRGFVADIEVVGKPTLREDGMAVVEIAALTLDD